ncbi:probable ATP-dependent RNA helicase DDX28 [Ptychodera flava]|uniref:probable ATP-dependent RNA helicase DDX28 n=1 Tax=Ptychodera flava TaxID=63121 RepID=UPI00396A609D
MATSYTQIRSMLVSEMFYLRNILTTGCLKCTALSMAMGSGSTWSILGNQQNRRVFSLYKTSTWHQTRRRFFPSYMETRHSSSLPSQDNVIRIPKAVARKLEKRMNQRGPFKFRGRLFVGQPGKLIISAKRSEFSHYQNQYYDKFKPPRLASQGWKHKKSVGDHFTINSIKGNPTLMKEETDGISTTFDSFNLHESLLDGLNSLNIKQPTKVQVAAIPKILHGHNVLCAAETGSGKTLTYLLPLLHHLKKENEERGMEAVARLPRSLVLVPSRELAEQVLAVARRLCNCVDLSANIIEGGRRIKTLQNTTVTPTDILIATPSALLRCLISGWIHLTNIRHVVIDEIDTMLDDSFKKIVVNIVKRIPIRGEAAMSENAQLIMTGATMPKNANLTLEEVLEPEALVTVATSYLHRLMPHVPQKFLRLHSSEKAGKLLELVKRDIKHDIQVMVFCGRTESCNWVSYFLQNNNIPGVVRLNGNMNVSQRVGIFRRFQKGTEKVLVCTDIGSRGLDTVRVQHVINFDFPNAMSDYIHRVGRVGRVGSLASGHVTSFIVHRWDVDLVNKIERAVRKRDVLPSVDANIKGRLNRIQQAKLNEDML